VSSKARKYVYSVQLRFLLKLINERQTAGSLWVDNMEESQVTTVEQYTDNMNNFSQEILSENHEDSNVENESVNRKNLS